MQQRRRSLSHGRTAEEYAATHESGDAELAGLGNAEQERELLAGHGVGYREGQGFRCTAFAVHVTQM